MGMSSSQPQPVTQGTMGSPAASMNTNQTMTGQNIDWKSQTPRTPASYVHSPVYSGMSQNAQNPVNPQPPAKNYGPIGGMVNSAQNQVNPQSSTTQFTPGASPMGNPGFMPMGNPGFMPMSGAHMSEALMGFGQMPQQPQMPMFGGPRPGKSPQ